MSMPKTTYTIRRTNTDGVTFWLGTKGPVGTDWLMEWRGQVQEPGSRIRTYKRASMALTEAKRIRDAYAASTVPSHRGTTVTVLDNYGSIVQVF